MYADDEPSRNNNSRARVGAENHTRLGFDSAMFFSLSPESVPVLAMKAREIGRVSRQARPKPLTVRAYELSLHSSCFSVPASRLAFFGRSRWNSKNSKS